jgi:outer membrane protein assembly factor BamB
VRGPSPPVAADSLNVYLGGSDRRVVAVDLESGKTRWAVRLPGPVVGGVMRSGDTVYVATDQPGGKVYALSAVSGAELWSTGTGYVQAPLALAAGRIIALNRKGQIVGLDGRSGKVLWRRKLPSTRVPPVALDDGLVMVTSYDSLYLVRAGDGTVTLRRPAPGPVVAPWIRVGQELVGGAGDSLLVGLQPDSLRQAWRVRLDAPLLVSPTARGDTVVAVTQMGRIYRVARGSPPTARPLNTNAWPATGTPALIGTWVLVGGADGTLHAFDLEDGSEAWKVLLGRPAEIAPVLLYDGSFLALGGGGDLQRMKQ